MNQQRRIRRTIRPDSRRLDILVAIMEIALCFLALLNLWLPLLQWS